MAEFFDAVGVLIVEGYGLTECSSPFTRTTRRAPVRHRRQAAPRLRGQARGRRRDPRPQPTTVFRGYHKDPDATAAAFAEDGWFHTGDVGEFDDDGFLPIIDRKKDILVTAGGKNVAPPNIENELKTSQYVSQALVVGDRRPYVAALGDARPG